MEPVQEQNTPVHDFTSQVQSSFAFTNKIAVIFLAVVIFGIGTGFLLSRNNTAGNTTIGSSSSNLATVSKGTIIGSDDTKTFKDQAAGVLKEGGIEGEGAFHLVRPGGESQNVYLTSSLVDLASLVDRKIKVWGETQKAQHAGWLMDVGRVEVLE